MSGEIRSVLIGLPGGARPRAAIREGLDLARALGTPATALLIDDPATALACAHGLGFGLGALAAEPRPERLMATALQRERLRVRAEFERLALLANVAHHVHEVRGAPWPALRGAAGAGDLLTLGIDLSEPGPALHGVLPRGPDEDGTSLLLVPEAATAGRGPLLLLAPAREAPAPLVRQLAAALEVALVTASVGAPEAPVSGPLAGLPPGRPRLLILPAGGARALGPRGITGLLRRFRAPLLVLRGDPER